MKGQIMKVVRNRERLWREKFRIKSGIGQVDSWTLSLNIKI
jgi:hypothetical protein